MINDINLPMSLEEIRFRQTTTDVMTEDTEKMK